MPNRLVAGRQRIHDANDGTAEAPIKLTGTYTFTDLALRNVQIAEHKKSYALLSDRWERSKPPTVDNMILVTGKEAGEHDVGGVEALEARDSQLYGRIISKLAEVSASFGILP
jgi:hypothetical protein